MFAADFVARLRKAAASDPEITSFENHNLGIARVPAGSRDEPARHNIGSFYPPEMIFGEPFDRSCLSDVRLCSLSAPKQEHQTFLDARVIGATGILADGRVFHPEPGGWRKS